MDEDEGHSGSYLTNFIKHIGVSQEKKNPTFNGSHYFPQALEDTHTHTENLDNHSLLFETILFMWKLTLKHCEYSEWN